MGIRKFWCGRLMRNKLSHCSGLKSWDILKEQSFLKLHTLFFICHYRTAFGEFLLSFFYYFSKSNIHVLPHWCIQSNVVENWLKLQPCFFDGTVSNLVAKKPFTILNAYNVCTIVLLFYLWSFFIVAIAQWYSFHQSTRSCVIWNQHIKFL